MNKYKVASALFLICILFSCDKYNLERTNPRDTKGNDYKPELPVVTTSKAMEITFKSVKFDGNVTYDGLAEVSARGVCWSTAANPAIMLATKTTDGTGVGSFTSIITGLTYATTYHVRAYATNSFGTAYGEDVTFTTGNGFPVVTTDSISAITLNSAVVGGKITSGGAAEVTGRGVCWSIYPEPTTALSTKTSEDTDTFTSSITDLTPNTLYYVRAYATNKAGTAYGKQISFTTQVTDIDGNIYNTVVAGTQIWMVENLKTTKYNDGTVIPYITDNSTWGGINGPAYCWYNNDITYKSKYGAIYSGDVIYNGKNVCPTGWHVPTDGEWTTLTTYLGGEGISGGKLKESGTTNWMSPNNGATNETGFTALPGGERIPDGSFRNLGNSGNWWSSTELDPTTAWYRYVDNRYTTVARYSIDKSLGFSIRCLRDN